VGRRSPNTAVALRSFAGAAAARVLPISVSRPARPARGVTDMGALGEGVPIVPANRHAPVTRPSRGLAGPPSPCRTVGTGSPEGSANVTSGATAASLRRAVRHLATAQDAGTPRAFARPVESARRDGDTRPTRELAREALGATASAGVVRAAVRALPLRRRLDHVPARPVVAAVVGVVLLMATAVSSMLALTNRNIPADATMLLRVAVTRIHYTCAQVIAAVLLVRGRDRRFSRVARPRRARTARQSQAEMTRGSTPRLPPLPWFLLTGTALLARSAVALER
jgi:hypothetical protein